MSAAGALGFGAGAGGGAAFIVGAAGTSAILTGAVGVALQQQLHIHLFSNQPSNVPARNHQKQHPKLLNNELIFTP
jgi:hypothetical protein